MKATPLIINWHDQNSPIYSAHFEPHGKERLATGGGDNNVRVWKVTGEGEDRQAEYLSTLTKHTQAVNVVRWAPKGEILASAGDDGNVILWVPSETHHPTFGNEGLEDKETWRAKHMFRQTGSEIYDLAWSPDASYFIIGSMDNVARIYNAGTGSLIRQIAEHSHYVQGVTWDPLNEYIATQSSDRSVHIYSLKTKDGQYTLNSHDEKTTKIASHHKMDLPPRRISAGSPAPPELSGYRSQLAGAGDTPSVSLGSPVPSQPGTPQSVALPMNPPSVVSHSRRSSFSSRRSVSPAPSLPLPAVMPLEPSPKPSHSHSFSGVKNASLYANETLTSFFRRLCFTPDGSLLLTPAGQYSAHQAGGETGRSSYDLINTVYVYTRGGINKPPIAHLPGHKKPSVAIRCSPVLYTLRTSAPTTRNITIDTSSAEDAILPLPEPLSKPLSAVMDPPPPPTSAAMTEPERAAMPAKASSTESAQTKPAFTLPYRMIYAVATQDAVLLYDTQQLTPLCIVSNLHLATFTDLTWSSDGLTLLISSSDGFCSTLTFTPGELGQAYTGELAVAKPSTTPVPSSAAIFASPSPRPNHQHRNSATSFTAPSPPATGGARPPSPTRSSSASSVATQSGPPLISGAVPSIAATNSAKVTGLPLTTPPETPATGAPVVAGVKRDASESEKEEPSDLQPKKRRVVPTPVPDPRV